MLRLKSILKYLLLTSIISTALMLSFTAQANDIVDSLLRDQDSVLSDSRFSDAEKLDLALSMGQVIATYQIEIPFLTELLLHQNNYAFEFYLSRVTTTYTLEKLFLHLLARKDITIDLLKKPAMIIANQLNLYSYMKILSIMNLRNPVGGDMDLKSKFVVQLLIQKSVQQKSTELYSSLMMKVFSTPEGFKHNQDLLVQMINVANPEQLGKVLIQMKIVKDRQTINLAIAAINTRIQEFDDQSVRVPESVRRSAKELLNSNDGHNGASMGCFMIYGKLKSVN